MGGDRRTRAPAWRISAPGVGWAPNPNGNTYLVSAARTPIGKFGGALAGSAVELGGVAIRAAVERSGLAENVPIDEVLMGQVLQAGPDRRLPVRLRCARASRQHERDHDQPRLRLGAEGDHAGAAEIRADAAVAVAGGMESMNQAPYLLPKARFGYPPGTPELVDATVHDGLWCSIEDCHMGTHAERVAISNQVSREDQDAFALASHQKAIAAIDAGRSTRDRAGHDP